MNLVRILQRRFLSLLSTDVGLALVIISFTAITVSCVQFSTILLSHYLSTSSSQCPSSSQNIGGVSFAEHLCSPTIDAVYTWVNGSDPRLRSQLQTYKSEDPERENPEDHQNTSSRHRELGMNRFRDNEELRYSLRSLWQFAPWIRRVFIVTNGQVPYWLNTAHPRIDIIKQSDIFQNSSHLPVFSSPAIESQLHRIPGLSKKFLYFNDDTMLGNEIWPDDFYTRQEGQKVYLSWDVPQCASGCPDAWLNDRYCDPICNVSSCNFDEGDCLGSNPQGAGGWKGRGAGGVGGSEAYSPPPVQSEVSQGSSYCGTGCPNSWLGDKVCDRACKTTRCGFDAGDCGSGLVRDHVPGFELQQNRSTIDIPPDHASCFIDMTKIVPFMVTAAEHECETFVRSAVIIQHDKMLILVMVPPTNEMKNCTVSVFGNVDQEGGDGDTAKSIVFHLRRLPELREPAVGAIPVAANGTGETVLERLGDESVQSLDEAVELVEAADKAAHLDLLEGVHFQLEADIPQQPSSVEAAQQQPDPPGGSVREPPGSVPESQTRESAGASSVPDVSQSGESSREAAIGSVPESQNGESALEPAAGSVPESQSGESALGPAGGSVPEPQSGESAREAATGSVPESQSGESPLGPAAGSVPGPQSGESTREAATGSVPESQSGESALGPAGGSVPEPQSGESVPESQSGESALGPAAGSVPERQSGESAGGSVLESQTGEESSAKSVGGSVQESQSADSSGQSPGGSVRESVVEDEPSPAPGARHLLSSEWRYELEEVLLDTAVEGIPARDGISPRHPDGIVLSHDMDQEDWVKAEGILRQKRLFLIRESEKRLHLEVQRRIEELETSEGVAWPWQLFQVGVDSQRPFSRKLLLDAFGSSLRFVTSLYNAYFSVQARKVPAHMPHLVDKEIIEEMHSHWPQQFADTAGNRFRTSTDMQFAFSYFYYMMERREDFDAHKFFVEEIDVDADGYVSEMELRQLNNRYRQLNYATLINQLINCSIVLGSKTGVKLAPEEGVSVTEESFKSCQTVLDMIKPIVTNRHKFKHVKMPMSEVTFFMVGDVAVDVRSRLQEILVERKKFVCLNDDMHSPEDGVYTALQEYFASYYPRPSPFELPPSQRNRYLHIDELSLYLTVIAFINFLCKCLLLAAILFVVLRRNRWREAAVRFVSRVVSKADKEN